MIEELGKHRQRIHRLEQYFQLLHKRVLGKQVEWETLNDAGEIDTLKVTRMDEIDARLTAIESGIIPDASHIRIEHLAQKVADLELRPVSGEYHTDFTPVLRQIDALKAEQTGLLRMLQTIAKEADTLKTENAKLWKAIDVLTDNATYVGDAKGAA